ncbi:MAG: hypothetical protein WA629_02220 [Candidatus Aquilonibacter sp.]
MNHEPSNGELMTAIVELHGAVTQGFARVDARFDRLEARVTSVEGELKGINSWTRRADERLDALEDR